MSVTENIVRDIFGDSDESDAEFEGFDGADQEENVDANLGTEIKDDDDDFSKSSASNDEENNVDKSQEKPKEIIPDISDSDSDDEGINRNEKSSLVYDFDIMLARRKEINSRRRKRNRNVDIINDSDDVIAELIQEMRRAADEDFELNRSRQAATRKLKILPLVEAQLKKIDLREALLDAGILGAITDWLTRLPDGSLPHLQIRHSLLKVLVDFNVDDIDRIKASGVGKAVMYIFKHPKETRENKKLASQLISNWSRPIFNLDTNFHSISRDEREQRDFEHMSRHKRRQSDAGESSKMTTTERILKPGEKGWVPRARVPLPSMKDYVVRPKSKVDLDMTRISTKKTIGRFEKHLRNFKEKKKLNKVGRAVQISIEGRKMAL